MNSSMQLRLTMTLCWLALVACTYGAAQETPEPQRAPPKFVVNVNRVLLPVVLRDKQGQSVNDLKKEDFQVFDNGKLRAISGFTVENRGTVLTSKATAGRDERAAVPANAASQSSALPNRITVFLFDDMH